MHTHLSPAKTASRLVLTFWFLAINCFATSLSSEALSSWESLNAELRIPSSLALATESVDLNSLRKTAETQAALYVLDVEHMVDGPESPIDENENVSAWPNAATPATPSPVGNPLYAFSVEPLFNIPDLAHEVVTSGDLDPFAMSQEQEDSELAALPSMDPPSRKFIGTAVIRSIEFAPAWTLVAAMSGGMISLLFGGALVLACLSERDSWRRRNLWKKHYRR